MEKPEQWKLVAEIQREIASIPQPYPASQEQRPPTRPEMLAMLEAAWSGLPNPYPNVPRDVAPRVGEYVLTAIDAHTLMGSYPPPELMVALSDILSRYLVSRGKVAAEEAFFGKPKRRSGPLASRIHVAGRSALVGAIATAGRARGISESQMAQLIEDVVRMGFGDVIEAESALRAKRRAKRPGSR